jgi:hypothetical protein
MVDVQRSDSDDQQRMLTIPVNNSVRPRSDHAIHSLLTRGSSNAVSSQVRKKGALELLPSLETLKIRHQYHLRRFPMELILIIVVLLLLFGGGGGYWGRSRGYW